MDRVAAIVEWQAQGAAAPDRIALADPTHERGHQVAAPSDRRLDARRRRPEDAFATGQPERADATPGGSVYGEAVRVIADPDDHFLFRGPASAASAS